MIGGQSRQLGGSHHTLRVFKELNSSDSLLDHLRGWQTSARCRTGVSVSSSIAQPVPLTNAKRASLSGSHVCWHPAGAQAL